MEPITAMAALSFACNILQLVQLSIEGVSIYKEVHARGSIAQHDVLKQHASDIQKANDRLHNDFRKPRSTSSGRAAELDRIAEEGSKIAMELIDKIQALKPGAARGWKRRVYNMKIATQTLLRSDNIEELVRRLKDCDHLLNSGIVKEL
jgi:hypothetical protein